MKKQIVVVGLFALVFFEAKAQTPASNNPWGDILNKAKEVVKANTGGNGGMALSLDEIARGLKQALEIGAKNSATLASKQDGYFGNSLIKILLPPEAQKLERTFRSIGLGSEVDKFVLALNRGAEDAAKKAAPIFVNAIVSMSFQDAMSILKGDTTAATQYLKKTTNQQLMAAFAPVIDSSLAKTHATKYYTDLANGYNKMPFTREKINPDLKAYATGKAIDGLFMLVALEEAKIRKDPAARITDLLKKVFTTK